MTDVQQQFSQMQVSPTAPVRLDRAPTPEEVLEFGEPTNGACATPAAGAEVTILCLLPSLACAHA